MAESIFYRLTPFCHCGITVREKHISKKRDREGERREENNDYGRKATSDPNKGAWEVICTTSASPVILASPVLRQTNLRMKI